MKYKGRQKGVGVWSKKLHVFSEYRKRENYSLSLMINRGDSKKEYWCWELLLALLVSGSHEQRMVKSLSSLTFFSVLTPSVCMTHMSDVGSSSAV